MVHVGQRSLSLCQFWPLFRVKGSGYSVGRSVGIGTAKADGSRLRSRSANFNLRGQNDMSGKQETVYDKIRREAKEKQDAEAERRRLQDEQIKKGGHGK